MPIFTGGSRPIKGPVLTVAAQSGASSALYTSSTSPAVYDSVANKTFLVYQDQKRNLNAKEYDHRTGAWSAPVFISATPGGVPVDDNHGAPSLAQLPNGKLVVAWGSHSTVGKVWRTTTARDISAWTAGGDPEKNTYHHLIYDSYSDRLWDFYRAGDAHGSGYPKHEYAGLSWSDDEGATWNVVSGGVANANSATGDAAEDCYVADCASFGDGKIWMATHIAHGAGHDGSRTGTYVWYYNIDDGHVYTPFDDDLGTQIDSLQDWTDIEVDSITEYTYSARLAFQDDGSPVVARRVYNGSSKIVTKVSRIVSGAWSHVDVGIDSNGLHQGNVIRKSDAGVWEAWGIGGRSTETTKYDISSQNYVGEQFGGDIMRSTSTDLVTWTPAVYLHRSQAKAAGFSLLQSPRGAKDAMAILAQGTGLASFSVAGQAIYGLGTDIARPGHSQSVLRGKHTDFWQNRIDILGTAASPLAPQTSYTTVDVSGIVQYGTTTLKAVARIVFSGSSNGATLSFDRGSEDGTSTQAQEVASGPGSATQSFTEPVEIPLSADRTFKWKMSTATNITGVWVYAIGEELN